MKNIQQTENKTEDKGKETKGKVSRSRGLSSKQGERT
jgi:hypothetical protein